MSKVIFDDEILYVRPDITEEDIEKEKTSNDQSLAVFQEQLLTEEDQEYRAIIQQRIAKYTTRLDRLDEHKNEIRRRKSKKDSNL